MRVMVIGVYAPDECYQSDAVCIEKAETDPNAKCSTVYAHTHKHHHHNYLLSRQ